MSEKPECGADMKYDELNNIGLQKSLCEASWGLMSRLGEERSRSGHMFAISGCNREGNDTCCFARYLKLF